MKRRGKVILIFSILLGCLIVGFAATFIADAIFRNLIAGKENVFIANKAVNNIGPDWFKHDPIILNAQRSPLFLLSISINHVLNFHIYYLQNQTVVELNNSRIKWLLFVGELFLEILTPLAMLSFLINFIIDIRFIYRNRFLISEKYDKLYRDSSKRVQDSRFLEVNEDRLLHELRVQRGLNIDINNTIVQPKNNADNADDTDNEKN